MDLARIVENASRASNATPTRSIDHPETRERIKGEIGAAYRKGHDDALAKTSQRENALDDLYGSVVTASLLHELAMAKISMDRNICWACHTRPAHTASQHRRCLTCDEQA